MGKWIKLKHNQQLNIFIFLFDSSLIRLFVCVLRSSSSRSGLRFIGMWVQYSFRVFIIACVTTKRYVVPNIVELSMKIVMSSWPVISYCVGWIMSCWWAFWRRPCRRCHRERWLSSAAVVESEPGGLYCYSSPEMISIVVKMCSTVDNDTIVYAFLNRKVSKICNRKT